MEYTLIHLTTVNSTNSYLKGLIKHDKVSGDTVVVADYQDGGKGQGENIWESRRKENLLFSWLVFPAFLAVSDQFVLSKAVSLGIVAALREFGLNSQIKWPNDIICNDKKLGGILIENSIQGDILKNSVVGIGINVNQLSFPSFSFSATSMSEQSGKIFDIQVIMERVMHHLKIMYNQLQEGDLKQINHLYLEKLYRKDSLSIFEAGLERFEGKILNVNEFGELEIEVSGRIRTFGFHSLKMIN